MSCAINAIEKICKSFGGVDLIQLIKPEELAGPIDQKCGLVINNTLAFSSSEDLPINIYFAKDTAQFTERQISKNRAGDYFDQALSFEVPKSRLEVCSIIHALKNRRVHILFRDRNKKVRILLNARLVADTTTRTKRAERNGYSFRATATSIKKAPYYHGDLLNLPTSSNAIPVMGEPDNNGAWGDPDSGEVWKF